MAASIWNILSDSRSVGASETDPCANTVKHAKRIRPARWEVFPLWGVRAKQGMSSQAQMGGKGEKEQTSILQH